MLRMIEDIITNDYFITWIGCVSAHILTLYGSNAYGTRTFMSKLFPKCSETFYNWADFIILPLIGVLLAQFLLEPQGLKACFFAGLSWNSALSATLNFKNK